MKKLTNPTSRFWTKVVKTDYCWLWTDKLDPAGYGRLAVSRKPLLAHRFSYALHSGEIPEGKKVDHKCHTRHCVNPKHLRLVNDKQNIENRGSLNRNNTSGYRGVTWDKANGNWVARVKHNRKTHSAGRFDTPEEAHEAALALRLELFTHNDVDRTQMER